MLKLSENDQVALAAYLKDIERFLGYAQGNPKNLSSELASKFPEICGAITLDEEHQDLLAQITHVADHLALGLVQPVSKKSVDSVKGVDALFETIRLTGSQNITQPKWHYSLEPLSATSIFPIHDQKAQSYDPLWSEFVKNAKKLPIGHASRLFLDGFDTLWQNITHAVPMFGHKDVSLYDHSKIMAALSVALFAWHKANPSIEVDNTKDVEKFLIIQGDFFGIQKFIFATGSQSNKGAAKLLRGRSFQVSLFSELAALSVLKACELPATSQILNAAGKFMILAPNNDLVKAAINKVKQEINEWFLNNGFGQVSLGLSVQTATSHDFESQNFEKLIKQSFETLEVEKYRRFNLTDISTPSVLDADYVHGVCQYNQSFPAKANGISDFSQDQIDLGKWLVKRDMLIVLPAEVSALPRVGDQLRTTVFGWKVLICEADELKDADQQVWANHVVRCWDFTLPKLNQALPWHGFARRAINAYVPRFTDKDDHNRYLNIDNNEENNDFGTLKTFGHLACENRRPNEHNLEQYLGKVAIATLKGDVDNLGTIFQKGLSNPSLTKMTALSRYMTQFFSIWLPAFCADKYPNVYTVFAGGDDFFMIGPWLDTQNLAFDMREAFTKYVAENKDITFSAGLSLTSSDVPLPRLSEFAEEALNQAKKFTAGEQTKNAVTIYGQTISWAKYQALSDISSEIRGIKSDFGMSTGYLYGLISVIDLMLDKNNIESGMWLSRFRYRTRRFANDIKFETKDLSSDEIKVKKDQAYKELEKFFVTGIGAYQGAFKIPLFNHFYSLRQR